MSNNLPPRITSFVIRFTQAESITQNENEPWRGAIRHVQSDEEATFTHWGEALTFMQQFLPKHTLEQPKKP